ncbi:MAG: type II toxin-antitoxin system death-on-curing family toxin [Alphaproteobacteria bacterium]|nr:type II toxin-antitoxin system death-on-curing family toxin [Alphaproteobacteria bacterium]
MTEPIWVGRELALALQQELIAEYGGLAGVRDDGLLESALARPKQLFAYGDPTLAGLAAAYAFGIARNHPFVDGNKRAALAVADVFLQLNGHEIVAPEVEAVAVFQDLAAGEIEEAELAAWIQSNLEPV